LVAPSLSEEDTEIEGKNSRIERRREGEKKKREKDAAHPVTKYGLLPSQEFGNSHFWIFF